MGNDKKILPRKSSQSLQKQIENLHFHHKTAGARATADVPVVAPDHSISDVQKLLYDRKHRFSSVNYVYVTDKNNKLVGVFSIKDVFYENKTIKVRHIMKKSIISVSPYLDQKKAARKALRNNIKAIPVVLPDGTFLGVITSDTILSILEHEHEEQLYKLSGITGRLHFDNEEALPVISAFYKRSPWILIGLLGGTFTASVIGSFEHILQKNITLAFFIPLMAYIANAVANQTQTIFIRDLAVRKIKNIYKYYIKQITASFLIALSCLVLLIVITSVFWHETEVGFVVGLSMTCAIMTATILGLLIPQVLSRFKIDPAVGAGPFATVIQDFLSILIYFTIASKLL